MTDPSRELAERLYEEHIAPLKKQIESLHAERCKYFDALEEIKKIRWGNDGDCGALAIIDKAL